MTTSAKTDRYADDPKPSTKAVTAIVLLVVAALFTWAIPQINNFAAGGPSTLPFPPSQLDPSPDHLALRVNAASNHNPDAAVQRDLEIRYRDFQSFRAHLHNISAQRGWYAHNQDFGQVGLVVPETELESLDPMVQDPVGWARTHGASNAPPKGLTSTELVNVQLNIDITNRVHDSPWSLLIITMAILAIFAGMLALAVVISSAKQAIAQKQQGKATGQPPRGH